MHTAKDEFLDNRFGEIGEYIVRNVTMKLLQSAQEVTREVMLFEETIDFLNKELSLQEAIDPLNELFQINKMKVISREQKLMSRFA